MVGVGGTEIVGPQRYWGHGLPGVQTGFTQSALTGEAVSRFMIAAREVDPRTEMLLGVFLGVWYEKERMRCTQEGEEGKFELHLWQSRLALFSP